MQQLVFLRGRFSFTAFCVAVLLIGHEALCADQLILRNLTIISDRDVVSFDPDGVKLDDGKVIGWDQIEQGSVGGERQAKFNAQLQQFGQRLHLVRQRLDVEDYRDLLPELSELYSTYKTRRSQSSYLVLQAKMWAHLSRGEREQALEPYLRCYELLRAAERAGDTLPGNRRLKYDRQTGFADELTPVWFDGTAAAEQLDGVREAIRSIRPPRPVGAFVYFATMALAAGKENDAARITQSSSLQANDPDVAEWKLLIEAQAEVEGGASGDAVASLRERIGQLDGTRQPVGLYWLGISELGGGDPSQKETGLLHLMRIAAIHGEQTAELAGAALYRVAAELNKANDMRGSVSVRNELIDRFGQTHFANLARSPNENP